MRSMKKLGVLVAVFALCAIGAANASAAEFTSTVEGNLKVESNQNQVFTINAGPLTCKKVTVTGKTKLASTSQHVTAHYKECTATSNNYPVHDFTATYEFTSHGTVHIKSTVTIPVTTPFGSCHVTVPTQTVGTVGYSSSGGKLTLAPNVTGIKYTTSNFLCGSSGENGTYTGNVVVGVEGGSLTFDK